MGSKKRYFFIFVFLFSIFFCNNFVLANEVFLPGVEQDASLPEYLSIFFNTAIQLAIILSVVVITVGGVYYMVSLGFGKITSEGKSWIKAGILGLIILLLSYLILYTINPNLITIEIGGLIPLPLPKIKISGNGQSNVKAQPYNEIPIGTLTEVLLTRALDCFNFDDEGEPIDGNNGTDDINQSLRVHDRLDCILKLSEAVEKKTKIFSTLSEEIAKLMDTCKCNGDTCPGPHCAICKPTASCPGGSCTGDCVKADCKGGDCCSPDIKNQIEHGPISVEIIPEDETTDCEAVVEDYQGLDEFRSQITDGAAISTVEKNIPDPDNYEKTITVIKKDVWSKLRLIDKLKYLKEKTEKMKSDFNADLDLLYAAENQLNSCYFAKSYIEFVKILEGTNNQKARISIIQTYTDPITEKTTESAKYCEGFTYDNSQCFYTCQNICNVINDDTRNCFKNAPVCSLTDINCLKIQKVAMETCVNQAPCSVKFNNFSQCIDSCRDDCSTACTKEYPACSIELEKCQNDCEAESDNLITNKEKCYFNFPALQQCAKNTANFTQFQVCANNVASCKYCSDQYAGDPECLKESNTTPVSSNYSALYLFDNPTKQKIQNCVKKIDDSGETTVTGAEGYPETLRCPICSSCPSCSYTNKNDENTLFTCTSNCASFVYNGDPLTFYCPQDTLEETKEAEKTILTNDMFCSKFREIPVGQTIDESEAWGSAVIKAISDFTDKTEETLQYIDSIGKEINYCRCDSKCDSRGSCGLDCIYSQNLVYIYDEDGNKVGEEWICNCSIIPCVGLSCLKMINLLRGGACPEGTEYQGVEYYHQKIVTALSSFKNVILNSNRSDILKRLNFSRQQTNNCSTKLVASPKIADNIIAEKEIRLFSCDTVENNQLAPIKSDSVLIVGRTPFPGNCYGLKVGVFLKKESIANNWFCCEKYE